MNQLSAVPEILPARARRWLWNVFSGYASSGIGALIYFLMTPLLISRLGAEQYAILIICHTITFYLEFLDVGLGGAQIRYHSRFAARDRQESIRKLLSTITTAMLIAGTLSAIIAASFAIQPTSWILDSATYLERDFRIAMLIIAMHLFVGYPAAALDNLYVAEQRFDIRNIRSIAVQIAVALAQLGLVLAGHGLIALVAVELAAGAILILIDLAVLRRLMPGILRIRIAFDLSIWRRVRKFAFWNFLDDLMVQGSPHLATILVALLLPLATLTRYSLAATLAGLLLAATTPVTATFFPMAARLHADGQRHRLSEMLLMGTKGLMLLAVPASITLAIFGNDLLSIWVADTEHLLSPALVPIMIADVLTSVFLTTSASILVATSGIRIFVLLTLAELVLTALLAIVLAPSMGLVGLATGSLVSNLALGLMFQVPIVSRITRTKFANVIISPLLKVLGAGLPGLACGLYLRAAIHPTGWFSLLMDTALTGLACVACLLLFSTSAEERRQYLIWWKALKTQVE